MQKAQRARAGQVDGREPQKVFDLEGEVRSWAKQCLAHMQLLLAHAISTPPPLSIQGDGVWSREAKTKERTNSLNLRIKPRFFSPSFSLSQWIVSIFPHQTITECKSACNIKI